MSFAHLNLHANIAKAIEVCGYTEPTPVQAETIPLILQRKDVVASAQTGTGKTAAFVLPALDRLCQLGSPRASESNHHAQQKSAIQPARILVLTPTRELADQITKAAMLYGKFFRFNIVSIVGGLPYYKQIKDLDRGADMIVATPGRLLDHIDSKRVDLSHIDMLILDEADRMLDMGFIDDVQQIAKLTPTTRQTLLFSATVGHKLISQVKSLLRQPVRIDLSNKKITVPQIKQEVYKTHNLQQKSRLLRQILNEKHIYKAIIFSATKINADRLANELCDEGFSATALHGDLKQNARNRAVEQLRRGKIQYLIATDVAARGIDIADITHVINFDLPNFCEDYVHRIGRTGRAGKEGVAISFVTPADMRNLQRIERFIGQRLQILQHDLSSVSSASDTGFKNRDDHHGGARDKKTTFAKTTDHHRGRDYSDRGDRKDRGTRSSSGSSSHHARSERSSERGDRSYRSDRNERNERSDRGNNARSDRGGYRPKSAKPAGDRPYTPYKDKAKFAKTTDDRDYSYKAKPAKASKGEFDDAPLVTVKKRSSSSPKPWDKNKKSGYGEKKFADRDRDHKRPSSERRFSSRERDGDRDNNRDRNPAAKRGTFAGAAKPAKKYGASFKHKKAGGAGARDRKPRD